MDVSTFGYASAAFRVGLRRHHASGKKLRESFNIVTMILVIRGAPNLIVLITMVNLGQAFTTPDAGTSVTHPKGVTIGWRVGRSCFAGMGDSRRHSSSFYTHKRSVSG